MEDDGPKAMKDFRSTQKFPTSADKFTQDHHGQYEMRGRQSSHRASRVRLHNGTYPKLHDEIEKKRILAKPARTANRKNGAEPRHQHLDNICCVCLQRRNQERRTNRSYRRRTPERTSDHKNATAKIDARKSVIGKTLKDRSGINKSKKRKRLPYARKLQYTEMRSGSRLHMASDDNKNINSKHYILINEVTSNHDTPGAVNTIYSSNVERCASDDMSLRSPSSSAPSMSSYNSYMSKDHEPMVDDKN